MAAIFQATSLNAFYYVIMYEFRFHLSLSQKSPVNNIPSHMLFDSDIMQYLVAVS